MLIEGRPSLGQYGAVVHDRVNESYYAYLLDAIERHAASYAIVFATSEGLNEARVDPHDERWDAIAEAFALSKARYLFPDEEPTLRYRRVERNVRDGSAREHLFEILKALDGAMNIIAVNGAKVA